MFVYVNNARQQMHDQANIKDMLGHLDMLSQRGIAIAINNNVIPRSEWELHILQPEDKLTLIKATQGG